MQQLFILMLMQPIKSSTRGQMPLYLALHWTEEHITALNYTAQHYRALSCIAQHNISLRFTALHCAALHYNKSIASHSTVLDLTSLNVTALHCTVFVVNSIALCAPPQLLIVSKMAGAWSGKELWTLYTSQLTLQ